MIFVFICYLEIYLKQVLNLVFRSSQTSGIVLMCSAHVAVCLILIILMRLGRSGGGAGLSVAMAFLSLAGRPVAESDALWHMVKHLTN